MPEPAAPTTTITDDEAHDVARVNASRLQPVLFVHGLWLLPSSWQRWPRPRWPSRRLAYYCFGCDPT